MIQSVVASRIDQADTSKFLEQFRYTIVASQLLSGHVGFGQTAFPKSTNVNGDEDSVPPDPAVLASVAAAILIAFLAAWLAAGGYETLTKKRLVFLAFVLAAATLVAPVYFKRQWLKFRMEQVLSEVSTFVSLSQDLDSATGAAVSLIQEVELVSRGYRMYVRARTTSSNLAKFSCSRSKLTRPTEARPYLPSAGSKTDPRAESAYGYAKP